jgi:hypothetical protein
MTVAALPNFKQFIGTGSTGPFTFAFTFDSNTELSVTVAGAGVVTLSPAHDYAVSGAGSSLGGSVTLTNALAVGSVLTVTRTLALEQDASLPNQGPFFSTTIEFALDRIVKMLQQLNQLIVQTNQLIVQTNQALAQAILNALEPHLIVNVTTSPNLSTYINVDATLGDVTVQIGGAITAVVDGGSSSSSGSILDGGTSLVTTFTIIDGGVSLQSSTVPFSGSSEIVVIKNDISANIVKILPPDGWTICGLSEYDLSVGGETVRLYPSLTNNFNRSG